MSLKPKFRVGQVVTIRGRFRTYFRIASRSYVHERVAPWDNGWWYYAHRDDGKRSAYSEYSLRPLTRRERGE
jgi:hypothetical protein